jgi:RNAse (barnase) inhibitor barstar
MRQIVIDGEGWVTSDDFYDSFFRAVGAPDWHGRNFNALRDSICAGQINSVEVPYVITITHYAGMGLEGKRIADLFIDLIKELHESGCPVDIEIEN